MSDKEDDATRAARKFLEWRKSKTYTDVVPRETEDEVDLAAAFRAYGLAQRRAGAEEARAGIVAWLRLPGNKPAVLHARDWAGDFADMIERREDAIEAHANEREETEEKCGRCGGTGKQSNISFVNPKKRIVNDCYLCHGTGKARKP